MKSSRRLPHNRSPEELGRLIARAHYQAWRLDAPPFDLTVEELAAILPNLITSGSAGIVWHRIKPVRERYGALAMALEAATGAQIAHNKRVETAVVEVVTRLRAYGIEPVLVKGLALAKLYPEGIVRPAGDIDLVIRKHEFAAAHAIIHDSTRPPIPIDVDIKHPEIWEEVPNGEYEARLGHMPVVDHQVMVLSKQDTCALVCFHFLKHGGLRPLWLCDFALILESLGQEAALVAESPTRQSWLDTLASTTMSMIGAKPVAMPAMVPNWLVENIYEQWVQPRDVVRSGALSQLLKDPFALRQILTEAWPTPIAAIFWQESPIMNSFPLLLQVREYGRRFSNHLRFRMLNQLRGSSHLP